MRRVMLIVLVVTAAMSSSAAWAGGRGQRINSRAANLPPSSKMVRGREVDMSRYPKFMGGFHARELENLGVPTGDHGLRGNGFSIYAW